MRKKQIKRVVLHTVRDQNERMSSLPDAINQFHVSVIERRLRQSCFSTEQKITVINRIEKELKLG